MIYLLNLPFMRKPSSSGASYDEQSETWGEALQSVLKYKKLCGLVSVACLTV